MLFELESKVCDRCISEKRLEYTVQDTCIGCTSKNIHVFWKYFKELCPCCHNYILCCRDCKCIMKPKAI